ncbi:hypothetical protein SADUNF_Sadunf16G0169700 [Salix dunnii]|uniref:Uncharacterized protein n=1 Tax=Salix dunnii TaxID=1413687 RepID=A0A835MJA5_9ROSI|nr:hypothetical protein SADUNF_Sadunf16G0169700 [Salix dunnii]
MKGRREQPSESLFAGGEGGSEAGLILHHVSTRSNSGKKLRQNVSAQTLHGNGVLLGRDLDKDIDALKDRFNFEV